MANINDKRVSPINKLVEVLRRETGEHIPWVDPFCGGVDAKVMLVLLRPGPKGAMASNFLSLANADASATNTVAVMNSAGLKYQDMMFWNIVPWGGPREEKITREMRQRGAAMLARLLPLLPKLKAVILLGEEAQKSRKLLELPPNVAVLECALPAPFVWNQTRYRSLREGIFDTFKQARAHAVA